MDSVLCCFSNIVATGTAGELPAIEPHELVSIQLVTRDSLDRGIWLILGESEPLRFDMLFPIESLRAAEYVGAKIRGSGIMQKLISAYHGKSSWDEYFDPFHFDKLLLSGLGRPEKVMFKVALN